MTTVTTATSGRPRPLGAVAALAYAGICHLIFLCVFLAFIAFVAGVLPPQADAKLAAPIAAIIDFGLVLCFALQHSIMARQGFKRVWTRIVPEPVERATYVLAASLALGSLILLWQPVPGLVWTAVGTTVEPVLWTIFAFGWATVLFTTFLIDHFELFGLRQAWSYASARSIPAATFKTPNVYRLVRHPMQLGFIIAFWAAPAMSLDRLAIAVLLTAYIVVALVLEERDLVAAFGEEYRQYQQRVPKLLPGLLCCAKPHPGRVAPKLNTAAGLAVRGPPLRANPRVRGGFALTSVFGDASDRRRGNLGR